MQTLSFPCNPPTPLNFRFQCRATVQSLSPPMRKSSSLYEVLRVNRHASAVEIKAAYRNLAKLYHPDASFSLSSSSSSSSDGGDFIQIHNAYETLADPAARALYDLSLGFGIGIGIGDRNSRSQYATASSSASSSSSFHTVGRRPTRRWETDQCW
ncbi:hypothetical protein SOVF_126600 [Spinacia oleracea]|uniref:Chaperone protein dnaJ 11, chloroplastic n=1 Tax=Spinacia oleracea TaxID=3562 RepID=A0A9R0I398_SPIOL|nr:chaperone protein dnaJ 11, chloroplastic [Spinacia oleracea]KNA12371.1 hypothetical protein SOVF_126600 [Spinacia oleracea]